MKRTISARTLSWLCVAVLGLSLVPLYWLSAYNHACYDDFGFSILTHDAWLATGSVLQTVKAAWENTIGIRQTWEGTYATSFISALQPAVFGEELYWVTTLVLLTSFMAAVAYALRQAMQWIGADRKARWLAFAALSFVMIQFVPELSEAFFWFNGGVAYTLLWSVMLWRIGVWVKYLRTGKTLTLVGLMLLTLVVGGSKYSTLLFALCVDALFVLAAFMTKRKGRWMTPVVLLVLFACFAFSATAPGNLVRAETLMGGMSPIKAILQAFYFGMALIGCYISLPMIVLWGLIAWQLGDALKGTKLRFNHPVIATGLCVCLFCAQLAPTLYTGNYIGDGRTVNTYFYTFVLMSSALAAYWTGFAVRKGVRLPRRGGIRVGALLAALVMLCVGCMGYQPEDAPTTGVQNLSSVSALKAIVSGQAQAYDQAMQQRDEALRDPHQPEVALRLVKDIPDAFMGDALAGDNLDYVLYLYGDYYDKQRVYAVWEE